MTKERDTEILSVRIKKGLLPLIDEAVAKSRKPSRNAWMNWVIKGGFRKHNRKEG